MNLTAEQDRALERLKASGIVSIGECRGAVELNAMRDLTKRGLARFARLATNCGYVLVGRNLMTVVR